MTEDKFNPDIITLQGRARRVTPVAPPTPERKPKTPRVHRRDVDQSRIQFELRQVDQDDWDSIFDNLPV